jgi:hypothetical protein
LLAVFAILAVWKVFASPIKLLKCAWAQCDLYDRNDCIFVTLKNFAWRYSVFSCNEKQAI